MVSRAANLSDGEFVRRILLVAIVVIVLGVFWMLSEVALLFFGAVLVSMTLRAMGRQLAKLGLGPKLSVLIASLTILFIAIGAIAFFGSEIIAQSQNLSARINTAGSQLGQQFGISSLKGVLEGVSPATDIATLIPQFLSWSISLGGALLSLVLVVVGGFYLAIGPDGYREGFLKLVPPNYQDNATATFDDIEKGLNYWIGGQLLAMAIVGVLTGLGLWLTGIDSPLALGVLAGLANFVPYAGSIAAAAITLVVASGQGWEMVAWAAGVMFVVQQIESNAITPLVVGRAVSISPTMGLFAIVAMAVLFGPLGVLFGFPLAIVADIAIRRLYIRDALDEPVEILGDQAEKSHEAVQQTATS